MMSYGSGTLTGFFIAPTKSTSTESKTNYVSLDRSNVSDARFARDRAKIAFADLASKWRTETAYSSSMQEMFSNENYKKIIEYGEPIVPHILNDLKTGPDHWYWALTSITKANPADTAPPGDLEACCDAWVAWGRSKGYID